MEWGIVRENDRYLYGEKVKAYLRKGAKRLSSEQVYPNPRLGYGALCVADSLPDQPLFFSQKSRRENRQTPSTKVSASYSSASSK